MSNKWKWTLGIPLAMMVLLVPLSAWTLFLPNDGHGMMIFGVTFPTWLIAMILLVLGVIAYGIVEEG